MLGSSHGLGRGSRPGVGSCDALYFIGKGVFMAVKTASPNGVLRASCLLMAVVVFVVVLAIRIRLLGIPLERDEGEYAYAGQLLLQGIPPYKLAYNMKFPGTYGAYAMIMAIFGQTSGGIHLGFLLVNAATITLVFFLGRRLVNSMVGITAAAIYAVLTVIPSVYGFAAHATHFVVLPVLAGTLLLLRECGSLAEEGVMASQPSGLGRGPPKLSFLGCLPLFASGLLFGVGLLMKQPAIFFGAFGAAYLLLNDIRRRFSPRQIGLRNLTFILGAILPFMITCLLLWWTGVFDKFWFWTIDYARQYASITPIDWVPERLVQNGLPVVESAWALWTLAAIGLIAGLSHKPMRTATIFLLGLFMFSGLAFSAGFYFREHYFILIFPALSLLAGIGITRLSELAARYGTVIRFAPLLIFFAAAIQPIFAAREFCFKLSPDQASRSTYRANPFRESVRIADYLRDNSSPDDTIAVLGSEPQIYFYSKRHSATGYIYMYCLMEAQPYARQMQEEMIREIEAARPKYLLSVEVSASWLRQPESERLIFPWANDYFKQHYKVVGVVHLVLPDRTDYYLGELPKQMPQLGNYILICERKS